jgi:hypothetical protein
MVQMLLNDAKSDDRVIMNGVSVIDLDERDPYQYIAAQRLRKTIKIN